MRNFLLLVLFLCASSFAEAQFNRYIITFTDKADNPFSLSNPGEYLSQRAIDRRIRYNIPLDSTDLPVTPRYIDSIRNAGAVEILTISKWLNQVAIRTADAAAIAKINSFPFVATSSPIAARVASPGSALDKFSSPLPTTSIPTGNITASVSANEYNYGYANGQVKIHHGDFLHRLGFRGEGMQIAVLDAGFYKYLDLPTFDSIRLNNQILETWDFVSNHESVNENHEHGMMCLSTIAANLPGSFVGTAPKASFYLYRTEDAATEYPIEEQNLAAGYERADSIGADITNTSLGYARFDNPVFDYTYNDMNGDVTIAARAADLAAKKGMLMIAAAGNEGNNTWHYLTTPSDADSVIAVGAVDSTGISAGFSSYGPAPDGSIKPALAAVGWNAVVANPFTGEPMYSNGTSFASPNLTGVATCLWQAFPEVNNMHIFSAMKISASRSNDPDDRVGYGIPDVKKAFVILLREFYSQQFLLNNCQTSIQLNGKMASGMKLFIGRKAQGDNDYVTIHEIEGNGSFSMQSISYTDDVSALPQGILNYRIGMQIGTDTTFYLDSAIVNYPAPCTATLQNSISISPNPAHDFLNLTIQRTDQTEITVILHSSNGQQVSKSKYTNPAGTRVWQISTSKLARGYYFLSVYMNNKKEITKKILLQ